MSILPRKIHINWDSLRYINRYRACTWSHEYMYEVAM